MTTFFETQAFFNRIILRHPSITTTDRIKFLNLIKKYLPEDSEITHYLCLRNSKHLSWGYLLTETSVIHYHINYKIIAETVRSWFGLEKKKETIDSHAQMFIETIKLSEIYQIKMSVHADKQSFVFYSKDNINSITTDETDTREEIEEIQKFFQVLQRVIDGHKNRGQ